MGGTDIKPTETTSTEQPGTPGTTEPTKSTRTKSTRNGGGGTGRGRTAGTKNSEPVEKDNGLSTINDKPVGVDVPNEPATPVKNPRGAGRKPGSKTKKPATKKAEPVDATHLILLLQTSSTILASRPGMEVFALSPQEAKQIAEPLAAIMSKNDKVNEIAGEYADAVALLIACATIFIPKFIMYQATKKAQTETNPQLPKTTNKEGEQNGRASKGAVPGKVGGTTQSTGNTHDVQNVGHSFNGTINELIPSII